jgi:hypothetical protein
VVEKYPNANPLKNHALMLRVHKDVTVEREQTKHVKTQKNKQIYLHIEKIELLLDNNSINKYNIQNGVTIITQRSTRFDRRV